MKHPTMLHPFARGYSWGTVYNVRVPQCTEHDPWFFIILINVEIMSAIQLSWNLKVEKSWLQLEVDSLAVNAVIKRFQI